MHNRNPLAIYSGIYAGEYLLDKLEFINGKICIENPIKQCCAAILPAIKAASVSFLVTEKHLLWHKKQVSLTCRPDSVKYAGMKRNLLTIFAMCAILTCGLSSCNRSSNLHQAAEAGNTEAVKEYIVDKADINAKDNKLGSTPVMLAATNGKTETVLALIEAHANLALSDKKGETALIRAARNGHTETVVALLNSKANPDSQSQSGTTALHAAAWNGHPATVAALLNGNAKPDVQDLNGGTPLTLAAHKKTDTPEAAANQTEIIKLLLAKGANVNAADILGRTALMYAAENNSAANIAALLEKQPDVNLQDRTGRSAFIIATEAGNSDIAKTLIAAGASMTPQELESYINRSIHTTPNIVELLKSTGLNLSAKGEDGKSALMLATEKGHKKTVEALQAAGITE